MGQPAPASEAPSTPIPKIAPLEAAAAQVRAERSEPDTAIPTAANPKALEVYEFTIDVVDGAGKRWTGQFKNQILDMDQRVEVGCTQARLCGGIPFMALDPDTLALAEMMAHLFVSLLEKPKWFVTSGEGAIKNVRVLNAVYSEVATHEATFRGSASSAQKSES